MLGSRCDFCYLWQNKDCKKRRMAWHSDFSTSHNFLRDQRSRLPRWWSIQCFWVDGWQRSHWWDLLYLQRSRSWQRLSMLSNEHLQKLRPGRSLFRPRPILRLWCRWIRPCFWRTKYDVRALLTRATRLWYCHSSWFRRVHWRCLLRHYWRLRNCSRHFSCWLRCHRWWPKVLDRS